MVCAASTERGASPLKAPQRRALPDQGPAPPAPARAPTTQTARGHKARRFLGLF